MAKIPQFIEIKNAGARIGSDFIAITKNGTISIYAGFVKKHNIKSFRKCTFLVDPAQNLIAIHFGGEELGKGAYTINHGDKTAAINASNIFIEAGFNVNDWYGRYEPEKYEGTERENVYMIDLDKKKPIIRKPKKDKTKTE